MTDFIISQELANEILQFLETCPYKDVSELIEGLRKLQKKV